MMSRVFAKESNQIVKTHQFSVCRQQNFIAVPYIENLLATTSINVLNEIDLGKRNRLAMKEPLLIESPLTRM
jgi:hypothetical protein